MKKFWFGGGDDILTATLLSRVCFYSTLLGLSMDDLIGGVGRSDLLGALVKTEIIRIQALSDQVNGGARLCKKKYVAMAKCQKSQVLKDQIGHSIVTVWHCGQLVHNERL